MLFRSWVFLFWTFFFFLSFLKDFERIVLSRRPSRWLELVAWLTRSKVLFFLRFVSLVSVFSLEVRMLRP